MMRDNKFPSFNEKKAVAAATKLLAYHGGKCDKYWLNKVMYFVERESLLKSGQPMFFDKLYSVPYGPIVSMVNDGIDASSYDFETLWSKHLDLQGNDVVLVESADDSVLSPFEDRILEAAYQQFKGWGFNQLKTFFHSLPEYKETLSREDITYEDILKHAGLNEEAIEEVIEELKYLRHIEDHLSIGA
jgi:uncharacterized phage-associated protein